ncbi:MAG: 23S rRNA (uracil-5-)-methyltransferase RumA, partial [Bacteroidetes bacterium]|nr:23S rRNA (uracil-5-)-methyltransferase RumA [Bacteroidota bacterium]
NVVIADPPRQGMVPKVVDKIIEMAPEYVIYVSCNPSTQARDIAQMAPHYDLLKIQPVDMFPQTAHVENIALLRHK